MKKVKYIIVYSILSLMIFINITNVKANTNDLGEKASNETIVSENDNLWYSYIEKFKNTDIVELYKNNNQLDITTTQNSIKIVLTDNNNSSTVNFDYNDGVLVFVPSNDDNNIFIEGIMVSNALWALSDLKGYDFEKVSSWVDNENDYTIEKDGIEYQKTKYTEQTTEDGITTTTEMDKILSFKLDIKNGLKTFNLEESLEKNEDSDNNKNNETLEIPANSKNEEKNEDSVKNPVTGVKLHYAILILLIFLSGISYILIRKKNRFAKYN